MMLVGIIKDRIKKDDYKLGFILDGFPRTLEQCLERICGRWIHKASGRSYHVQFKPPKSLKLDKDGKMVEGSMLDDETGEALMQRPDDTPEALVKRLEGYHRETVPILDHYKPKGIVCTINGNQDPSGVWDEVQGALKRK